MTIEQISKRIIKDIKAWPEESRQSQDVGGPKTSWDEYKEQIQYEEYDSFEVFEESIESMVRYDVSELSEKVIENLFRSRHTKDYNATREEKIENIVNAVLCHIKTEAESQDIEYDEIDTEFVSYLIDDLTIVAEILSKVAPEEFIIRCYSQVTGAGGEQGVANLSDLADEQGFEWISPEEFEMARNRLREEQLKQREENSSEKTGKRIIPPWDSPEVLSSMKKNREKLNAQSEERNRRIQELQSQMDQQGIPMGELREVRFRILEKELYLDNLLDELERGEQSRADMNLIPEIQHDLIILRGREKQILDIEKLEKAQIAKAVKDLVLLTAKATGKTSLEVIREMKTVLSERKLASQN
jgi:hypothetical protein